MSVFNSNPSDTGHLSLQDPNDDKNKNIREEYKQFRNDCLSDIVPFKPEETSSNTTQTTGGTSGGSAAIPGSLPAGKEPKKSEIPVFDKVELVLEKNTEYQTRQKLLNSDEQNLLSEDSFFELIKGIDITFLSQVMNVEKFLPKKSDVKNEQKLKRWIQIVSGFILNQKVDSKVELTDDFKTLLRDFDPSDGKLTSFVIQALSKTIPQINSYYYFAKSGDKSIIHYCIETPNDGVIAIPIGQTTKQMTGTYSDVNVSLKQGLLAVSSHGAIHTKINDVIGDKLLYGDKSMEFGIYAATSESKSNHDFRPGKAFLPLFLPHQHRAANHFFMPIKGK
jgi:hypothetical protein